MYKSTFDKQQNQLNAAKQHNSMAVTLKQFNLVHGKSCNIYQLIHKKKLDEIVLQVGFGRGG